MFRRDDACLWLKCPVKECVFCLSKILFIAFGDKKSGGYKHAACTHKLSRAVIVESTGNYAYL